VNPKLNPFSVLQLINDIGANSPRLSNIFSIYYFDTQLQEATFKLRNTQEGLSGGGAREMVCETTRLAL
jgi:hypothetical protein